VADATSEAILRKMSDLFKGAQTLSYNSTGTISIQSQTLSKDTVTKTSLRAKRPNLVQFGVRRGAMAVDNISDGSQVFSYVPALKAYLKKQAPKTLQGLILYHFAMQAAVVDDSRFAFFFLMDDPYRAAIQGASKVEYLGTETLDGVACQQIKFHRLPYSVTVWFQAGDRPLPLKMAPDTTGLTAKIAKRLPGAEMRVDVIYDGWELGAEAPASLFQFTPPSEAEEKQSFAEMAKPKDPQELIGKPAPTFKTEMLGGGEFNLADHKGKDVVILDFWATWCGPCVYALPLILEVADEYKSRGVYFLAVNQGDKAETIRGFLEKKGLQPNVGLDEIGKAGSLFYVSGIPQTVIIGKDGLVKDVHVGLAPDIQDTLRRELDVFLSEGSTAASAPER
jgi:peroxiredoxin